MEWSAVRSIDSLGLISWELFVPRWVVFRFQSSLAFNTVRTLQVMDGHSLSLGLERKQLLGGVIQVSTPITIVKVTQKVCSSPSQSLAATDIKHMAVCVGNYVNTLRFRNIG